MVVGPMVQPESPNTRVPARSRGGNPAAQRRAMPCWLYQLQFPSGVVWVGVKGRRDVDSQDHGQWSRVVGGASRV